MLTSEQLNTFKMILTKQKDDFERRLKDQDHYDIEKAHIQESVGELSNYDNHPGDGATELYEREKDIALLDHLEKGYEETIKALDRIEAGTYGKCVTCNKDIPVERLEAVPTTLYCKDHSPNQEVSHQRPVEEEVFYPPFGKFDFDHKNEATFYDSEDSWQDVAQYGTSESPSDFVEQGKLYYNQMYTEAEEPVGYVEDIEAFLTSDIEGNFSGVANNIVHEQYEKQLDGFTEFNNDDQEAQELNEQKRYDIDPDEM
ncbi:TraR/DksA C4-type zinc finger protein [Anaerobacillus sp. MEB173]|uniref:TraR/DksA C4-type zinc finger protein n=1 Tax=Anaerobacillus sp. MEB173 TaxID=3383345 RepID=UPI003F9267F8